MKKDITPTNDKGEPHGYWEIYYTNGQLWYIGNFVNRREHGYWEEYYPDGELIYKGYYDNGKKVDYVVNNTISNDLFPIY